MLVSTFYGGTIPEEKLRMTYKNTISHVFPTCFYGGIIPEKHHEHLLVTLFPLSIIASDTHRLRGIKTEVDDDSRKI